MSFKSLMKMGAILTLSTLCLSTAQAESTQQTWGQMVLACLKPFKLPNSLMTPCLNRQSKNLNSLMIRSLNLRRCNHVSSMTLCLDLGNSLFDQEELSVSTAREFYFFQIALIKDNSLK
jgi:hypothetical protein